MQAAEVLKSSTQRPLTITVHNFYHVTTKQNNLNGTHSYTDNTFLAFSHILSLQILFPCFVVHAGNFIHKFFLAPRYQEKADKKLHVLKSDEELNI